MPTITIESLLRRNEELKRQNDELKSILWALASTYHELMKHEGALDECHFYSCKTSIRALAEKGS